MIYSNTSTILSYESSFKWAKIREHFKGYAHSSSVKFSKLARDVFFLKFFKFFLLFCARRYCAPAYLRFIFLIKSAHYTRENTVFFIIKVQHIACIMLITMEVMYIIDLNILLRSYQYINEFDIPYFLVHNAHFKFKKMNLK